MKSGKRLALVPLVALLVLAGIAAAAPAANAASWQDVDGDCHNGGVSGISEYLWCWDKKKRVNDSTPNIDVFAFHMSLSGQASASLNRLWVEMDPRSTSPVQSWYSTDPRKPNQTYTTDTSCRDWHWEIGFDAQLVNAAYGESGTICSNKIEYEPKNNTEPGHHAGVFWKSDCWAAGTTKRVTAAVLVKVNQGEVPLWDSSKHGMDVRSNGGACTSY